MKSVYRVSHVFHAARQLPKDIDSRSEGKLHGHSFTVWCSILLDNTTSNEQEIIDVFEANVTCIAEKLNYSSLNNVINEPTDFNIAKWFISELSVMHSTLNEVGISPDNKTGLYITLDTLEIVEWHKFRFESAHQLPNVPDGHPCGRMHGHGFELIVYCKESLHGEYRSNHHAITEAWKPLGRILSHNCLNDIEGLENPTSENLSSWCYKQIKMDHLWTVSVFETATAGCHFDGITHNIWKDRPFEAALMMSDGENKTRLFGHSYILRLGLTAPVDPIMGWTIDYGEVKKRFDPIYQMLDHNRLDQLNGLTEVSNCKILQWIRIETNHLIPWLSWIQLSERPEVSLLAYNADRLPTLPI